MKVQKQPADIQPNQTRSRRSFLAAIWGGLGIVAVAEFLWIGASFFKPRKSQQNSDTGGIIEVGAVGDFAPGSGTPFRQGGFYLSRLKKGGFLALSSRCTHLGCVVSWHQESARFECPCHSSIFDITGNVIRAPAPRPLDYFSVVIEKGRVSVQTDKKIKRQRFRDKQVTNA